MRIVSFILFFVAFPVKAQTVFSTKSIELGDIYAPTDRFGDILVTNKGREKAYILRVEKPAEVVYRASSDILLPDSSFSFRLQANPLKKGPFSYEVEVYTSDSQQPAVVRISGNVKELPRHDLAAMQSCPDFGSEPSRVEPSELTIITVDEDTRQPLAKSTVTIIRNGEPTGSWITGRKGSFKQESVPGYFYFLASRDAYLPKEAGVYVGPQIREITIPLKRDAAIATVPEPEVPEEPQEIPVVVEQQLPPPSDSVIRREIPELASIPTDNFTSDYFKPVNIVFVLDVSSSMKIGDKMELMKYSLNTLVGSMRAEDHIALVTYSDEARVLLAPTVCTEKEMVRSKVAELRPKGLTAGGKGIKLGYREALRQYSPDKANMVVIITDGAFNKSSDDYQRTVRKYAKKGITFSVVGIQNKPNDETLMREAAAYGKGRFVPIGKLADAQYNLLQEIRIASFRGL